MTKENQKKLYLHYKAIAENVKKNKGNRDFKPIIRENAQKHMEEIDKSWHFSEVKAKVKTETPKIKTNSTEKK